MNIEQIFERFLATHSDPTLPLILGLSGGVDSLCLLYLLMKYQDKFSYLHIAHVNHQWRSESGQEADQLRDLAQSLNFPFHLKIIDPQKLEGNLEDACRHERIAFFTDCARECQAQAVILGHHADDQAETVLKRVLEGAPLNRLGGISSVSSQSGVPFWRPLLEISKKEIQDWMMHHGYQWFEDVTNADPRYLRARMRESLIPLLNREFGKNIVGPLCRLSEEMGEVEQYLKKKVMKYLSQKTLGSFGACYDFSLSHPEETVEWKALVRLVCENESFPLSRTMLANAVEILEKKKAHKEIEFGENRMVLDRGCIFFLK